MILALSAMARAGVGTGEVPDDLRETATPRRVALVIGVNTYGGDDTLHNLRFAAADAEAVGTLLEGEGYEVTELTYTATKQMFWEAFSQSTADLQSQDLFVLYIAGHAQLQPDSDEHQLRLLFSDTDAAAAEPGVGLTDLSAAIDDLSALQRVVVLDTCYSERTQQLLQTFRGGTVEVQLPPVGRFDAWLFAAAPQQSAQEDAALGHGVFTHYLLEGLSGAADADGDGNIGVLEVYNYVGYHTAEHTGRAQVPRLEEDRIGWADLPLVQREGGSPQSAILPWYADVLPRAEVYIDEMLRGPGGVPAGRYTLEVRDGDTVLLRRKVSVDEGEALAWEPLLAATSGQLLLGVGAGIGEAADNLPLLSPHLDAWFLPRAISARRLAIGGQVWGGSATITAVDLTVPVVGASARLGLWHQDLDGLTLGPTLGLGGVGRAAGGGLQVSPSVSPGVHVHASRRRTFIGLDASAVVFSVDGEVVFHPQVRLSGGLKR